MTGVGLGKRGGGGPVPSHQEKASSAAVHKRWSSLCARGGFPFTEIGCSTTRGADFSLVSALPRLVNHLHSLVSFLYQHWRMVGGQKKKGGQGEELVRQCEKSSAKASVEESYPQEETRFFVGFFL